MNASLNEYSSDELRREKAYGIWKYQPPFSFQQFKDVTKLSTKKWGTWRLTMKGLLDKASVGLVQSCVLITASRWIILEAIYGPYDPNAARNKSPSLSYLPFLTSEENTLKIIVKAWWRIRRLRKANRGMFCVLDLFKKPTTKEEQ